MKARQEWPMDSSENGQREEKYKTRKKNRNKALDNRREWKKTVEKNRKEKKQEKP